MSADPKDRAELSRIVWQAALAAERGDRLAAAELLELAAQRLRRKGGEKPKPAPARE
jgi:hypothetical protein